MAEHGGIDVFCPHCTATFEVPRSMKSGLANCPECGLAVQVPGGPEALFWLLLSGGIVLTLLIAVGSFFASGPAAAVGVLVVGAAIITVILMAS